MKHHFFKKVAIACLCASFSSTLLAAGEAGRMHVQIANGTSASCILADSNFKHGKMLGALPPGSLMAGDSRGFDMWENWLFGPRIALHYQCNMPDTPRSIRFDVRQPCGWFFGQTPELTVEDTNGLNAIIGTWASASRWSDTPGTISVTIIEAVT